MDTNNPLVGKAVEFRFTQNNMVAIRVNGLDVGSYPIPPDFTLMDAASLFSTVFGLFGYDLHDFANYTKQQS